MLSSLVPESAQRRIQRFVDEVFLPRAVLIVPGAPPDMIDGPVDEEGWVPWKPVPSPVTDADILALEAAAGTPFPPLFRAWLMYKCLLMTDFGTDLFSLPQTPSDAPLEEIASYVEMLDSENHSQAHYRRRRVVPFASDGNGVGPLCFDLNRPLVDGDYPVVLFDHELLHRPDHAGRPFADSFAVMLDMAETSMLSYDEPAAESN